MSGKKIEERCLKGLKYRYSKSLTVEENGKPVIKYTPMERDLTPDDVLSCSESPEGFTFVTADGIKYFWDRKTQIATDSRKL